MLRPGRDHLTVELVAPAGGGGKLVAMLRADMLQGVRHCERALEWT
jgi:hypothetical protein